MNLRSVLSILSGIMTVLALEQMIRQPLIAPAIGGVFFVVIMALVVIIFRGRLKKIRDYSELLLPALYLAGIIVVATIAQEPLTQHLAAYVGGVGLAAILQFIGIQDYETFSRPATIATTFIVYFGILGLDFYLTPRVWFTMLAIMVSSALLAYQSFARVQQEVVQRNILYSLIVGLAVSETMWTLTFWPTQFFITTVVLTVVFYSTWGLAYIYFKKILNRRVVTRYLAVSVVALALILSTARWIA